MHAPQNSGNSRPCPTTHQVDITEVVEPEMIQGVGGERQVPAEEAPLTLVGCKGQAAQNPGVHGGGGQHLQAGGMRTRTAGPRPRSPQAGPRLHLLCWLGYEVLPQGTEDKAQGVPELVAEMAVVQDLRDRQVQVAPWRERNRSLPVLSKQGWLSTQGPSAMPAAKAHPGFHESTTQTSRHLSHTQGSHEESPFSATKGRRVASAFKAAGEAGSHVRGLAMGLTCAAAAIASSLGSKLPSLSLACSTWGRGTSSWTTLPVLPSDPFIP